MIERVSAGLVKFWESKIYTEKTVPRKLKTLHDKKPGIWARIVVLEGCLDYVVPDCPRRSRRLETGDYGVIRPSLIGTSKSSSSALVFQMCSAFGFGTSKSSSSALVFQMCSAFGFRRWGSRFST